jgi:hypothetical protein
VPPTQTGIEVGYLRRGDTRQRVLAELALGGRRVRAKNAQPFVESRTENRQGAAQLSGSKKEITTRDGLLAGRVVDCVTNRLVGNLASWFVRRSFSWLPGRLASGGGGSFHHVTGSLYL